MKISIGSDHGGYQLKTEIVNHLIGQGHEVVDFGTNSSDSCDYPDFAYAAAKAVANGEVDFGVVVCTTGMGVSMVANKVKGIRCALCHNENCAEMTRRHNDANMIAFGQKYVTTEVALKAVDVFLSTAFEKENDRHVRRVNKIVEVESK
ncbi:MAG: ribose 5-phosphate isomerase B [Clostridia bacterium]|nr:ribose 5-phosphate isomerase B [Clostridia bacterium]